MSNPDVQDTPPTIREVFDSTPVPAAVADERVPGVDVNLDVERVGSKVEVVAADGLLGDGFESTVGQPGGHLEFTSSGPVASRVLEEGERSEVVGAFLPGGATDSVVGSLGVSDSLVRGHLRHTVGLGFASGSYVDPGTDEPLADSAFTHADDLGNGDYRFPFPIQLDEVVDVHFDPVFSGHVYNLHTEQEWYVANDIVVHNCHPWQECPYEEAKDEAIYAKLAIINSTYFLTEANYVGRFGPQFVSDTPVGWSHPFIIIDEADVLEDELMRFVEWNLSARMMSQLGIDWPEKKTVAESWIDWAVNEAGPKLKTEVGRLRGEAAELRNMGASTDRLVKVLKRLKTVTGLESQLEEIAGTLGEGWVYTGYERPESKYAGVTFKPIRVNEFGQDTIWRHGERFLLMSATVISPEQMAEDLGLEDHEWAAVWVESGFPVENRPVYVRPRARMTAKTKDESYPKMVDAIQQVLDAHPNERTLIHTVSYALTDHLESNLVRQNYGRPILSYTSSAARAFALQRYQEQQGAVLLAPSFERGVDLPDDLGRVVIIAKVPYPYLGDKQVSKRLYTSGGQRWYTMQTIRSIVQMSGRAMRHEEDSCAIYILDSMFMKLWKESRHLFPQWWKNAIVWQP